VAIFEAERERERLERTWTTQRRRWLELARLVRAPDDRRRILAAAPLSAATVASSRALYMSTADAAVRAARSAKDWDEVSRIRREQAVALAAEVGNSVPPIEEAVELHREAMAATLRALAKVTRRAELVGASCCAPCRADYGRSFRIADELRTPRLPHDGCPHGLCACDWWPVLSTEPRSRRRRRAGAPATAQGSPAAEGQAQPEEPLVLGDPGADQPPDEPPASDDPESEPTSTVPDETA
jgi:adenosyl cobinamide kinase/adenosyl cobinamide phosphate guanylyltransferase